MQSGLLLLFLSKLLACQNWSLSIVHAHFLACLSSSACHIAVMPFTKRTLTTNSFLKGTYIAPVTGGIGNKRV